MSIKSRQGKEKYLVRQERFRFLELGCGQIRMDGKPCAFVCVLFPLCRAAALGNVRHSLSHNCV